MPTDYFPPLDNGAAPLGFDELLIWLGQQTISFQKIITGSLQVGQTLGSSNFVAGSSGWQFDGAGNLEANDATFRGTIFATAGEIGNLTIAGILTLGAGGQFRTASSGNHISISTGEGQESIMFIPTNTGSGGFAGAIKVSQDVISLLSPYTTSVTNQASIIMDGSVAAGPKILITGTVTVAGNILSSGPSNLRGFHAQAGSASTATHTFDGDTDTGSYSPGSNQYGITTGGTQRIQVDNNETTIKNILNLGGDSSLIIASGVITVTQSYHQVDTQSEASTDDLDNINGGSEGSILVLRSLTGARDIVLRDAVGNIRLAGSANFTLLASDDTIMLLRTEGNWVEVSRSVN